MDRVHVALRGLARRSLAARPGEQPARRAAVLVPLCNVGGEPCVLFTVRTRHVSSHKGQVAFPGGYQDPEDEGDPWTTAERELVEEVGWRGPIRRLGLSHDALAITGTYVTPAVGFLEHDFESAEHLDAELTLDAGEVAGAFVLSLAQLQDPTLLGSTDLGARGRIPVYRGGPAPVWGLTAYILSQVLEEVLLPTQPAGTKSE